MRTIVWKSLRVEKMRMEGWTRKSEVICYDDEGEMG